MKVLIVAILCMMPVCGFSVDSDEGFCSKLFVDERHPDIVIWGPDDGSLDASVRILIEVLGPYIHWHRQTGYIGTFKNLPSLLAKSAVSKSKILAIQKHWMDVQGANSVGLTTAKPNLEHVIATLIGSDHKQAFCVLGGRDVGPSGTRALALIVAPGDIYLKDFRAPSAVNVKPPEQRLLTPVIVMNKSKTQNPVDWWSSLLDYSARIVYMQDIFRWVELNAKLPSNKQDTLFRQVAQKTKHGIVVDRGFTLLIQVVMGNQVKAEYLRLASELLPETTRPQVTDALLSSPNHELRLSSSKLARNFLKRHKITPDKVVGQVSAYLNTIQARVIK